KARMKKALPLANGIALVITIFVNYLSNTGVFNGKTIAEVSKKYPALFTPADYAFAIWGLIYLGLLAFVFYQGRSLLKNPEAVALVQRIGGWFILSCLANSCWVLAWVYDLTGLSVLIMGVLFFSLLKIIQRTDMELTDPPLRTIAFVWWPFCLYSGWISVALLANVAAYLTKIKFNGWGIGEAGWAILLIAVAGALHLFMTWKRNMREFALVGVWALVAIAVANREQAVPVAVAALVMAGVLFISSGIHGYRNRELGPFRRR
ncbi:MAG: hypothetical protein ABUL46_06535, partial [Chitinophaga rupis]